MSAALEALGKEDATRTEVAQLVERYRADHHGMGRADLVNALTERYCDVLARKQAPYAVKGAELASFVGQLAEVVTGSQGAAGK